MSHGVGEQKKKQKGKTCSEIKSPQLIIVVAFIAFSMSHSTSAQLRDRYQPRDKKKLIAQSISITLS